jgi:hypothetical protein
MFTAGSNTRLQNDIRGSPGSCKDARGKHLNEQIRGVYALAWATVAACESAAVAARALHV